MEWWLSQLSFIFEELKVVVEELKFLGRLKLRLTLMTKSDWPYWWSKDGVRKCGTSLVVQWLGLCDPSAGPGFDLWSGSWIPCAATSISQVTSRDPSADQQIKIFKKLCQNLSRRGFREACDTSLLAWSCNKDFSTPNSSLVGCLASLSPPGTKTCS